MRLKSRAGGGQVTWFGASVRLCPIVLQGGVRRTQCVTVVVPGPRCSLEALPANHILLFGSSAILPKVRVFLSQKGLFGVYRFSAPPSLKIGLFVISRGSVLVI